MPAPSKTWVTIADSQVDADSPLDSVLMTGMRDNDVHLKEWLGKDYTAAQNHDHDGVNSKKIGGAVDYKGAYLTTRTYAAGSTQRILTSDAAKTGVGIANGAYTKLKEFQLAEWVGAGSALRISFKLQCTSVNRNVSAKIYRGNTAVGTVRTTNGTLAGWSEDISGWGPNDTIGLWACPTDMDNDQPTVSEFRVDVADTLSYYNRTLLD